MAEIKSLEYTHYSTVGDDSNQVPIRMLIYNGVWYMSWTDIDGSLLNIKHKLFDKRIKFMNFFVIPALDVKPLLKSAIVKPVSLINQQLSKKNSTAINILDKSRDLKYYGHHQVKVQTTESQKVEKEKSEKEESEEIDLDSDSNYDSDSSLTDDSDNESETNQLGKLYNFTNLIMVNDIKIRALYVDGKLYVSARDLSGPLQKAVSYISDIPKIRLNILPSKRGVFCVEHSVAKNLLTQYGCASLEDAENFIKNRKVFGNAKFSYDKYDYPILEEFNITIDKVNNALRPKGKRKSLDASDEFVARKKSKNDEISKEIENTEIKAISEKIEFLDSLSLALDLNVEPISEKMRFCTKCGFDSLDKGWNFCGKCGTKM